MKRMKLWILMCVVLLLPCGCLESIALVAIGATGGITVDHLLRQAQEDVQENIDLLEQQNVDYEKQLEQTIDEAEKEKIRAQIKDNLKLLEQLKITELTLQGGRKGLKVDWRNPEAIALFATTLLGLFMSYRQWKKKQKTQGEKAESEIARIESDTALEEVVVGLNDAKKNTSLAKNTAARKAFRVASNEAQSTLTRAKVTAIRKRIVV